MSDSAHLEELVIQEKEDVGKRLLTAFASMVRDSDVRADDYPARLRQVLDGMFAEAANARNKPDGT